MKKFKKVVLVVAVLSLFFAGTYSAFAGEIQPFELNTEMTREEVLSAMSVRGLALVERDVFEFEVGMSYDEFWIGMGRFGFEPGDRVYVECDSILVESVESRSMLCCSHPIPRSRLVYECIRDQNQFHRPCVGHVVWRVSWCDSCWRDEWVFVRYNWSPCRVSVR